MPEIALNVNKKAHPTDDKRWKAVDAAMQRHGYKPKALIETLHAVQNTFGYIEEGSLEYIAECLSLPPSKVYGVATFYNLFSMKPQGEHTLVVCTGTACYVKGTDKIVEFMQKEYGLKTGETTADNKLSFVAARCVGACGLAPVMILDGKVVGKMSVEEMKETIREWVNHE
jgi:bidirectional [NiFe] hydrogenase diaphorase subunit